MLNIGEKESKYLSGNWNIGNGSLSFRLVKIVLIGILCIIALLAGYLSFHLKFPNSLEVVNFSEFPTGRVLPDEYFSPYGIESENFTNILPDEEFKGEKFLRLSVDSGEEEWWGITISVLEIIPLDAVLRLEMRSSGEIRQFNVEVVDGKREHFMMVLDLPNKEWSTVSIPLAKLIPNDWQPSDIKPTGKFVNENVQSVNFTFHAGSHGILDVRRIDFTWRSGEWMYVTAIFVFLAFGFVLWRRTSAYNLLSSGEWDFRSDALVARIAYILFIVSILFNVTGNGIGFFSAPSIFVYSFFFLFITLGDLKKEIFSERYVWSWRFLLVLATGWYIGFTDNYYQLACLLGIALLPMIQIRSRVLIFGLPVAALIVFITHPEYSEISNIPHGVTVIGTLTIFFLMIRYLISNAEAHREHRHAIGLYETALEHSSEAILAVNKEGIIERVNRGFEDLIGISKTDVIGREFAEFIHPADRLQLDYSASINDGKSSRLKDLRIINRDGEEIKILMVREIPLIKNEILIGFQIIGTDVTDRRSLERQLYQAQRLESLGSLAGGVAHDFNNLLGGILGYATFLKMKVTHDHEFYKPLNLIEKGVSRAADLTRKLLAFSRGGGYDIKPLNVNSIVEETVAILNGSLNKSIIIKVNLDQELPCLEGDSGQIQQLLMNLCVNARDAMPDGGELLIKTSQDIIDEEFTKKNLGFKTGRYIVLSVSDSGLGIDKKIQEKIFDPFFTTKEHGKGTGLGLSMVHGIVKTHSGIIQVHSEPGKGSEFRVYFPASEKQVHMTKIVSREVEGGAERILVVDDEDYMREMVQDVLESAGYTVITAADGEEALSIYTEEWDKIDLVILDMIMPRIGGRDVFLRMQAINPNVKVLISTGYSTQGPAREIIEKGAAGVLQKPYRSFDLHEKIRTTLGGAG